MSRWGRVPDGEGQVALIIGEAGIGKSRLVQRFHEQISCTPHNWVEAGAGAFFQNTPFYPVTEMLRQMLVRSSVSPSRFPVSAQVLQKRTLEIVSSPRALLDPLTLWGTIRSTKCKEIGCFAKLNRRRRSGKSPVEEDHAVCPVIILLRYECSSLLKVRL
jgi:hypothetical protein